MCRGGSSISDPEFGFGFGLIFRPRARHNSESVTDVKVSLISYYLRQKGLIIHGFRDEGFFKNLLTDYVRILRRYGTAACLVKSCQWNKLGGGADWFR